MRFQVVQDGATDTERTVFTFDVSIGFGDGLRVSLDSALVQARQSRRHGWKADDMLSFSRHDRRLYRAAMPDVPADVFAALRQMVADVALHGDMDVK